MRAKIAYITPDQFLGCFECVDAGFPSLKEPGSCNQLRRVRLLGVPEGAQARQVWFDHSRHAFGILVFHDSFPEVPFGMVPETIQTELQLFQVDHEGKTLAVRDAYTYGKILDTMFEYPKPSLTDIIEKCRNPEPPTEPTTWRDRPSLL